MSAGTNSWHRHLIVALLACVFAGTLGLAATADETGTIQVGGRERSYLAHVPAGLPPAAPLVLALHGTGGTGARMRAVTGGELDQLADAHGFAVVYPDGILGTWDDCRRTDASPAKEQHVDDVSFFRALVARFHERDGIDPRRVYVLGYSNGAQMAMRVALEAPELVAGIAAVSANLPVPANSICHPAGRPVAVLLMDGTGDPINPFQGGEVRLSRSESRGVVMSTAETAAYWVRLAGETGAGVLTTLPHRDRADPTSVTVRTWRASGRKPVTLFVIKGGGHVVPNPHVHFPAQLGPATEDVDAPVAIWDFFSGLPG